MLASFSPLHLPRLEELDKADKEKNKDSVSDPENSAAKKIHVISLSGLPVNRSMVQAGLVLANTVAICYRATDFGLVSVMLLKDCQDYVDFDTGPPVKDEEVRIVSQDDEETTLPTN